MDLRLYRINAIKRAAYKYTNIVSVALDIIDEHHVVCRISPIDAAISLSEFVKTFQNELLDQELREELADETKGIRDVIIAQAFSPISLLHPELDGGEDQG